MTLLCINAGDLDQVHGISYSAGAFARGCELRVHLLRAVARFSELVRRIALTGGLRTQTLIVNNFLIALIRIGNGLKLAKFGEEFQQSASELCEHDLLHSCGR